MAQQPLQLPPDEEWEREEALFREDIARKAEQLGGIYKQALQPGPTSWEEEYLLFYLDLLDRALKHDGIYRRALEGN